MDCLADAFNSADSKESSHRLHHEPSKNGLAFRAITSPALLNRCVLDWFGDWSDRALYQVGTESTHLPNIDLSMYNPPANFPITHRELSMHRTVVVNALVYVHSSLHQINQRISRRQGRAERKKAESIGIQPALVEQDKPIHQQPAVAEAESAVKEATADVRSIKRLTSSKFNTPEESI
ncbi:hypothetical protein PM082_000011 [Marasmius tenuissimus]|nr:hypothetical protein PM082_000011 [Marasmius tenuissimus]